MKTNNDRFMRKMYRQKEEHSYGLFGGVSGRLKNRGMRKSENAHCGEQSEAIEQMSIKLPSMCLSRFSGTPEHTFLFSESVFTTRSMYLRTKTRACTSWLVGVRFTWSRVGVMVGVYDRRMATGPHWAFLSTCGPPMAVLCIKVVCRPLWR
jgi:hypothetical protein